MWSKIGLTQPECEAKLKEFARQIEQVYLSKLNEAQSLVQTSKTQIDTCCRDIAEVCQQLVDAQDSLALVSTNEIFLSYWTQDPTTSSFYASIIT